MRIFLVFILAPLLISCATTASVLPDGNNVALGQTAYVDGPKIRLVAVIEDSRCPINARCIRAGTFKVSALWVRRDGNQPLVLELGKSVPVADGRLTLVSVMPLRGGKIEPSDYRFNLKFEGGL